MKILLVVTMTLVLSGCATAWMPVKYSANKVCEATPIQQDLLAESFDKGTYPHRVRIHCYGQVLDDD